MKKKFEKNLAVAIAVAGVLIAGALIYAGTQLATRPDEARVRALIEERLTQSSAAIPETNTSKTGSQNRPRELSDKEFNTRVEKAIIGFIDKQRRAEQDRPTQLAKNVPPLDKNDHLYGNPKAPVSLIE